MDDDIRQAVGYDPFFVEEEEPEPVEPPKQKREPGRLMQIWATGRFMGMSAAQRFVVSLLLLLVTFTLGTFLLLITQRGSLPF